jgi:putative sigma-54 modulation protein
MDIRLQSIHFDATSQLQAFVQKKVSKLDKFYDISDVEVTLKVVKPETSNNKEAAIKVKAARGEGEFYTEKTCDTFEEAIDEALDALSKQLIKHKEKMRMK